MEIWRRLNLIIDTLVKRLSKKAQESPNRKVGVSTHSVGGIQRSRVAFVCWLVLNDPPTPRGWDSGVFAQSLKLRMLQEFCTVSDDLGRESGARPYSTGE